MTEVKEVVEIDEAELFHVLSVRMALSEPDHASRMSAIRAVRHDVTDNLLQSLFSTRGYREAESPKDDLFLRWAAESGPARHEAAVHFMEVARRYEEKNERKLNIAEEIGSQIVASIKDGAFRGLQVPGGILEQVREQGKKDRIHGARDKDTLRKIWNDYRGVVHLGMAIEYLEQNPDQTWHPLHLAEFFRGTLSTHCPKGTRNPYVSASEQIKFLYSSRAKGPRFRDRGLHFFDK